MTDSKHFDPNGVGVKGTLFGLPYDTDSAETVVIPVPWDVTASYSAGSADGPEAILKASPQIDYGQPDFFEAWKLPVAMSEIPEVWQSQGKALRIKTEQYIDWLERGSPEGESDDMQAVLKKVNAQCAQLMEYVQQECSYWRSKGKRTILLGGDHSTALGHIRSLAEVYPEFGILQIDAHADLREAYEGFEYSHASIMYNALKLTQVKKLVQVGVRDYCEEEYVRIRESDGRIETFFDQGLKEASYEGERWNATCKRIMANLPKHVYLSFDIDGLDPKLCPNTGTPVPGGFELDQVMFLIKTIVASGRVIIGCDLNEVAPGENEWDANVGARALFLMNLHMARSQGYDFEKDA